MNRSSPCLSSQNTGYQLLALEALRWNTVHRKQALYKNLWTPFFQQAAKLKQFWGTDRHGKILFECSKHSIHTDNITELDPIDILTKPIEDLPTLINDLEDLPNSLQALKNRLEGKAKQLPKAQHLVDMYSKYNRMSSRYFKIIANTEEKILSYLYKKLHDIDHDAFYFESDHIVSISLNGRVYLCSISPRGGNKILVHPEDSILKFTDQDVLKDESLNPLIHGVKKFAWVPVKHARPRRPKKAVA